MDRPVNHSVNWSFPTAVHFGAGRVGEVVEACATAGIANPLLVTDHGLLEHGPIDRITNELESAGVAHGVFADVRGNPTGADVDSGVSVFRDGGHDGVIAVGGGSPLDVGKLVAFMAGQDRPIWDFEDIGDNWQRADATAIAPSIAVPTAAGTGSEVGRAGVVVNPETGRKVIVFHPGILPVAVICDPELTVGLPQTLTVGTGIDALSHSLEAVCAPGFHPMAHGIGLEGCRLVLEHLPRVLEDPADIGSRGAMMAAALMGAVAFQKGLGGMHALSHPIGAMFDTHHGMTNAVVMPFVLRANESHIRELLDGAAPAIGIDGGYDEVLDHIVALRSTCGVPHTLVDLGVDPEASDEIVAAAVADPSAATNPKAFTSELAAEMFSHACTGDLTW